MNTQTDTPATTDTSAPARRSRLRLRSAVPVVVTAGALVGLSAAPALASPIGWSSGAKAFGDCTITARTYVDGGYVIAGGNITCGYRHSTSWGRVHLKVNGAEATTPRDATYSNSYGWGNNWGWTPWVYNGVGRCNSWQAVVEVWISGLGSTYVTTGSPRTYCS